MKAMYRLRLVVGNQGGMLGVTEMTEHGAPVDGLLAHNVERLISTSR
jgi:hypothetical protein